MYDISKIREAEEVEFKLRSNFFANIAHEFKTPLNSIVGLIKQINAANGMDANSLKSSLTQIGNLSNYVIFLINDIIEYSNFNSSVCCGNPGNINNNRNFNDNNNDKNFDNDKNNFYINNNFISNNDITNYDNKYSSSSKNPKNANLKNFNLNFIVVNLKEITYFCADIANSLILNKSKENHLSVNFEFDEKINELEVYSDEYRLKQILLNFLSNAVKFTRSGFITIKSEIVPQKDFANATSTKTAINKENNNINLQNQINGYYSKNTTAVKVSVSNTGIGMSPEELQSLLQFKKHSMQESAKNLNQEGSGLGLSIVNEMLKNLNHSLFVESEEGKGSVFSLIFKAVKIISTSEIVKQSKRDMDLTMNMNNKLINYDNCNDNDNENSNITFEAKKNNKNKIERTPNDVSDLNLERLDSGNNFESSFRRTRCKSGKNLKCFQNQINVYNEKNEIIESRSFRGLNYRSNIDNVDLRNINNNFNFNSNANKIIENTINHTEGDSDRIDTKVLEDHEINNYLRRPILINYNRINSDESSSSSVVSLDVNSKYSNKNNANYTHINFTKSLIDENDLDINRFFNPNNENMLNYINNCSSRVYDIDNCNNNNNEIDNINNNNINSSSNYSDEKIKFSLEDNSPIALKYSSPFKEKSKSKTTENPEAKSENRRLKLTGIDQEFRKQHYLTNYVNFNSSMRNSKNKKSNNLLDNKFEKEKTSMIDSKEKGDEEIEFKSKVTINIKSMNCEPKEILEEHEKNIILIVDDHTFIRESLKSLLNKVLKKFNLEKSFKIEEAQDGSEIITKVIEDQYNKNRIKCVITDENMEFMNGSDAVRFLKKMEKNRKIRPIIFASNSSFQSSTTRNLMRDVGFEFFLSKPCCESEVHTLLKECNII